jgi:hypothetical protein
MENIEDDLGSLRVRFQAAKLQAYFKAKTALSVKFLGTDMDTFGRCAYTNADTGPSYVSVVLLFHRKEEKIR